MSCTYRTLGTARTSVGQPLLLQLGPCSLRLREAAEPHALENALRLRELDVAVVDDLPLIPPRIEKVVAAEHPRARLPGTTHDLVLVVDDEAVVAGSDGLLGLLERDELVSEIDEGHAAAAAAQLRASTSFPRNSSIASRSPTWTATWLMPTSLATWPD